ncbi:MAG: sulfurtransferase complex subunit TusB [Candidatus Cryosericum sp.]
MALIIVKKSAAHTITHELLKLAMEGDTVAFIQDGTLFAADESLKAQVPQGVKLVALKEDYLARGFTPEESQIPLVDYDGFAEITEQNERVIS